jgi:hypothetical protein
MIKIWVDPATKIQSPEANWAVLVVVDSSSIRQDVNIGTLRSKLAIALRRSIRNTYGFGAQRNTPLQSIYTRYLSYWPNHG